MAKLRRTLLIGLGGTGIKAILNAKKMFYENYGQIPPMIGFIGMDTDKPGLSNASVTANDGTKITLNKSEQLCISVDAPTAIYTNNQSKKLFDWMPECNVQGLTALSIGAGQMRSNGRFAVTVNELNVKSFISNKITEINNASIIDNVDYDLLGSETEVHMVFSLGGGTGSGTFLNTAYLIKRMYPTIKLSGYAVLSDVFRNMVTGAMSARVRPNAKGAIIDLDYLAHLTPDDTPVEIKWLRDTDRVNYRPFDALYFIDNTNENNDMFNHVDPLCEMIALAIVTSVGELGVALASVSDNVSKLIADGTMDIKNKKAWVAGFGCAEIIFDGKRIAKIYARKAVAQLINKMLNGGCDDPVTIANNWFDNVKIRENLGKDDVIDYFMTPMPKHIFSDLDEPQNPEPECKNYLAKEAGEPQSKLDERLAELESRVDEALTRLTSEQANRECGIYLCQQILISILHQIEICDGEMKDEKEHIDEEMPRLEAGLKTACKELAECMGTVFKRNRKDYEAEVIDRTMRLAVAQREVVRRKMARQFYSWLKERVNQSVNRVDIIISNLQTVRNECNTEVQKILRSDAGRSFFQFDLSADYAEKVECPLTDIVFNDFAKYMQSDGGISSLAALTSKQTEETLMRFVNTLPKVNEYEDMTVDDALDKLSDDELSKLIGKAVKKSLPLLPFTLRGFDADLRERPVECYYIGIANKNRSRLTKDNLFQNIVSDAKDIQFSEVGLDNRVIIYRQLGVVPAFTIKALDSYEAEYERWESDKHAGSHWDNNLCKRMADERFQLSPKDEPSAAHLLEMWINAIIFGLIKFDAVSNKYQIKSRGMGGRALKGWLVDMGASRQEAFRYLEDNIDVLGPEIRQTITTMDVPGPENPIRILSEKAVKACQDNTYLQEVSQCPISIENIEHYPAEMDLIEKEIEYILDNIAQ
ncbi:MAG: tubulin-like doman-containing protein [Muribaculaceae bacterium]|nr:tubulin-like doman-containing protein [Muribaculaceae bacterium]